MSQKRKKESRRCRGKFRAEGVSDAAIDDTATVMAAMYCNETLPWLDELKYASNACKPYYLHGFPVVVQSIAGRGRGLIAEFTLSEGDLVLSAERMGSAIRMKQDRYWCCECLQHRLEEWSPPLPLACSTCEAVWLCSGCKIIHWRDFSIECFISYFSWDQPRKK